MKSIKFNDWQDLSLKKDIEIISKKINNQHRWDIIAIFELILAIISFVSSCILEDKSDVIDNNIKTIKIYFGITIIAISILIPLIVLIYKKIKLYLQTNNKIYNKKYNIKLYVDIFDNNICYYSMMAKSFLECIGNREPQSVNEFYYIQCHYYINKCIFELYGMSSIIELMFEENEEQAFKKRNIHQLRLIVLIDVLKEIRTELKNKNIDKFNDTIKIYDEMMIDFVNQYNETKAKNKAKNKTKNNKQILSWKLYKDL